MLLGLMPQTCDKWFQERLGKVDTSATALTWCTSNVAAEEIVLLLTVFTKAEKANILPKEIK